MEKPTKVFCDKCHGNGFYSVPYSLAHEEVHVQCDQCKSTGEIEVITPDDLREKRCNMNNEVIESIK